MLLDAYHLHRSGRGGRGFEGVSEPTNCSPFQYSDCSPAPVTGVKRPMDRLLPGEGVVAWSEVLGLLAEIGYDGYLSYEAPNPALWERSPYALCRDAVRRRRALLQQAAARRAAEWRRGRHDPQERQGPLFGPAVRGDRLGLRRGCA